MNKTTIVSLLAAAALLGFGMTGCAGQSTNTSNTGKQTTTSAQTTATTTTTETTTTQPTTATTVSQQGDNAGAVVGLAQSLVGCAYRYGAAGPKEFDNSGFLVYCYGQNGITIPRKTRDISTAGTAVERDSLQHGDAVFFYNETPGAAEYAGIYIGNNQFAASNQEEKPVSVHSLTAPYFVEHFVGARRFTA